MSRPYRTILVILTLCSVAITNAKGQSPVKDKDDAKAFVQKFYTWYVALYNKDTPKSDLVALKKYPQYFDATLSDALVKDYTEQPKNANEILGLDGDPFLNAQDTGFDYLTGDVKQVGNKFLVNIHGGTAGELKNVILKSDVIIIPELVKVNGQWKFTNFLYPVKDGGGSLLKTLATLRKERQKWIMKHNKVKSKKP